MILPELAHEPAVRKFVTVHNQRIGSGSRIEPGQTWVRLKPFCQGDLDAVGEDSRFMKFTRVGAEVVIVEETSSNGKYFIDIACCGDRLLVEKREFLETWVKFVPQTAWSTPPFHTQKE